MSTALTTGPQVAEQHSIPSKQMNISVATPTISQVEGKKQLKISGLQYPAAFSIDAPSLQYSVEPQANPGEVLFNFKADGKTHDVSMKYLNQSFAKFALSPSPVAIEFDHPNKKIHLKNVYDHTQLKVESATLPFSMSQAGENGVTVSYTPGNQVHDVKVSYQGKMVEGGNFRLAPKPVQQYPVQMAAAPAHQYMMQPTMMMSTIHVPQMMYSMYQPPMQQMLAQPQQMIMPQMMASQPHMLAQPQMQQQMMPQMTGQTQMAAQPQMKSNMPQQQAMYPLPAQM